MRIPLKDSPITYKVDAHHANLAGLPAGEYLMRITEFGVSLAWRERSSDTWLPPALATDVSE